jgi:hypothetical protein
MIRFRLRLLIAVCLVWLTTMTGIAQTATPTPVVPDFVILYSMELASVEIFRSNFVLTPPATAFERITLTVTQPGWSASGEAIEIDLNSIARVTEPFTDFTHLWTVDPANPPTLFRDLTFTWSFTLADLSTESISSTVIYADPRTAWIIDENPEGPVKFAVPEGSLNPVALRTPVQTAYNLLNTNTGQTAQLAVITFDPSIPINPCEADNTTLAPISQQAVPCNPNRIEQVYTANGYIPLQVSFGSLSATQDTIIRLLFDTLYPAVWSEATIPAWFRYGLREFYTSRLKLDLLAISQNSVRVNRAITDMSIVPQDDRLAAWEAQSYGMVLYIAEKIGVQPLFQLARDLGNGENLVDLYQLETGQPLSSLIPTWSNWIYTAAADAAYQYNPYLPTTPTPIPSLTRTPTLTLTLTPTLTLTITPSVTGILSPTPSDTPTATLIPTLTVTPRPAGSILIPTAAPAVSEEGQTNDQLSIILVAGLLIIGLVVIAIVYFRRSSKRSND